MRLLSGLLGRAALWAVFPALLLGACGDPTAIAPRKDTKAPVQFRAPEDVEVTADAPISWEPGVPDTGGPSPAELPLPPPDPGPPPPPDPGPPAGPVDACFATATGQLGQGDDPIDYQGEPVAAQASHVEDVRCLSFVELEYTRQGKCPLTLRFGTKAGVWHLQEATLRSDPECGDGWGSGKTYSGDLSQSMGSMTGLPPKVAKPVGAQACTLLEAKVELMGALVMVSGEKSIQIELGGLGFEGALLSTAMQYGDCGSDPVLCSTAECGPDPLFGTSCGTCQEGQYCHEGTCVKGTGSDAACARFNQDRAALFDGQWLGSTSSCSAGAMSQDWQERALLSVNLYRWFAGLPPLSLDPSATAEEQACALMLHANGSLSHNPPFWWQCYTSTGADGAGSSHIATMPAVEAVDLYMIDPGNASTLGHRRWILSNWLSSTAFGSTSKYSCMRTSGYGGSGPEFTAWPPPGYYPMGWHALSWTNTDDTGWSIQSDSIKLGGGSVTVTENGQSRPVSVGSLSGGYGSQYAIKITPKGWSLKAGATYQVTVSGASKPVSYSFQTVKCSP